MLSKICTSLIGRNVAKSFKDLHKQVSTAAPLVLTKEYGEKSIVSLNRPNSMNAMSDSLLAELITALRKVEKTSSLVIIKGEGDRAFSAGGDLIKLARALEAKDMACIENTVLFLNVNIYLVYRYKIPVIVFMDGVSFGGGAGLPTFANFKIATERTRFAMPESKLGFHPNAAATYFFNHCKGYLGYYLALTGNSLIGSDVVRAGFATHYCESKNLQKLENEILKCSTPDNLKDIIDEVCEKNLPEFSLNPVIDKIDSYFSERTVEGLIQKLKNDQSSWAKKTLKTLNAYSPTCLKVILRQLQKGIGMNLIDILAMESCMTVNFYDYPDVIEGTRIVLKDKNDTPKWQPSKLEDVTEEAVEKYFAPTVDKKQRKLLHDLAMS